MVLDTADVIRITSNEMNRVITIYSNGHQTLHDAIWVKLKELENRIKTLEDNQKATEKDVESLLNRVLLLEEKR